MKLTQSKKPVGLKCLPLSFDEQTRFVGFWPGRDPTLVLGSYFTGERGAGVMLCSRLMMPEHHVCHYDELLFVHDEDEL